MKLKTRYLQRDNYVLGWNQTKKTDKTLVHVSLSTVGFLNHPITFLGAEFSGLFKKNPNIDGETCTAKWVLFLLILWCLLVLLCTLLPVTSALTYSQNPQNLSLLRTTTQQLRPQTPYVTLQIRRK